MQRSRRSAVSPSYSARYCSPSPMSQKSESSRTPYSPPPKGVKDTRSPPQQPSNSVSPAYPRMGIRKLPSNNNTSSCSAGEAHASNMPSTSAAAAHSPELPSYQTRNNRRYEGLSPSSSLNKDCNADEFEVLSLCGNENSNASFSDLDNVCEIEDSEINSEFEN